MKNSIIISESYNVGPTGIVVKNLVDGFIQNKYIPLIVTYSFKEDGLNRANLSLTKKTPKNRFLTGDQIYKAKMILFRSLIDLVYSEKDIKTVKNSFRLKFQTNTLEFVLVIMSGAIPIRLLRLGYKLAKLYEIPFIVHATDPLPSPVPWGEKSIYRKAVLKAIKPFYSKADLISATNPLMLDYQLNALKLQYKKSFVLYNPTGVFKEFNSLAIKKNTFLYLGSLYGKRNPEVLIDMFIILLDTIADAKLIFVGSAISLSDYSIPRDKLKNFKVVGWTDNPEKHIEEAEILLDYNANIENDVFIASKLTKYVGYNRKILALSGKHSAPEDFIENQENIGIWNASFLKKDFVQKSIQALNTDISDWSKRAKFCKSKNADIQIKEFVELVNKN
jgi:glycosyltransferase involved in cell wall biosynthesis